jgi:protein-glutamine gamma-glutamyltransferase
VRLREPSEDQLLAELERALGRCGRPVGGGLTLAALEHRFRSVPDAAGYVGSLRRIRFGGGGPMPTPAQRRALRAQLRAGLGVLGRLRALWALPPRWTLHGRRSSRSRSQ